MKYILQLISRRLMIKDLIKKVLFNGIKIIGKMNIEFLKSLINILRNFKKSHQTLLEILLTVFFIIKSAEIQNLLT